MPLADEDVLFEVGCGELPVDPPAAAVIHFNPETLRAMTYVDERFPDEERWDELVGEVRRRLQRFIDGWPDVDGWGQIQPNVWQLILRDHYLPDIALDEPDVAPALEATEPGHSSA